MISHLLCSALVAQDFISLPPAGVSEHLGHHAWILETPKDSLSINEVLKDGISRKENAFQDKSDIPLFQ